MIVIERLTIRAGTFHLDTEFTSHRNRVCQ